MDKPKGMISEVNINFFSILKTLILSLIKYLNFNKYQFINRLTSDLFHEIYFSTLSRLKHLQ